MKYELLLTKTLKLDYYNDENSKTDKKRKMIIHIK